MRVTIEQEMRKEAGYLRSLRLARERVKQVNKLRARVRKPRTVDPIEIYRRLPKRPGINDLYTSQAEVLKAWFDR